MKYDNTKTKIIIEAHIIDDVDETEAEATPLSKNLQKLSRIICNGYNLLEPEHATFYPLQQLEILVPKVFETDSILKQNRPELKIVDVYFKEESALIDDLKKASPETINFI
jgi:hypothetical protein